jgi:hypothetical protein
MKSAQFLLSIRKNYLLNAVRLKPTGRYEFAESILCTNGLMNRSTNVPPSGKWTAGQRPDNS